MKITGVDCTALVVPDCDQEACDSSQDTVVVEVHSDEGISSFTGWVEYLAGRICR